MLSNLAGYVLVCVAVITLPCKLGLLHCLGLGLLAMTGRIDCFWLNTVVAKRVLPACALEGASR